ncbi:unnamed protein product [Rangifer tarandus platyrhynchus]|uniref:Uncharacterized protein n=2 Tax=Rangifer tarandus platyrhynchus TaxID=3082113 RepID=A0ABN9A177_RANTA|nr:unnamed protein product [Rangifer tarandus platyrhynchus]CAI9711372.1 unnamed protein product [Rangifer tarandus platyrhynchus]
MGLRVRDFVSCDSRRGRGGAEVSKAARRPEPPFCLARLARLSACHNPPLAQKWPGRFRAAAKAPAPSALGCQKQSWSEPGVPDTQNKRQKGDLSLSLSVSFCLTHSAASLDKGSVFITEPPVFCHLGAASDQDPAFCRQSASRRGSSL